MGTKLVFMVNKQKALRDRMPLGQARWVTRSLEASFAQHSRARSEQPCMRNKDVPKVLHSVLLGSYVQPSLFAKKIRDTIATTDSHQRTACCALAGAAEVEPVLQARLKDPSAHVPHIVSGCVPFCVHQLCSRQR